MKCFTVCISWELTSEWVSLYLCDAIIDKFKFKAVCKIEDTTYCIHVFHCCWYLLIMQQTSCLYTWVLLMLLKSSSKLLCWALLFLSVSVIFILLIVCTDAMNKTMRKKTVTQTKTELWQDQERRQQVKEMISNEQKTTAVSQKHVWRKEWWKDKSRAIKGKESVSTVNSVHWVNMTLPFSRVSVSSFWL